MIDIDDAWLDTAVTEFSQFPDLLTDISVFSTCAKNVRHVVNIS